MSMILVFGLLGLLSSLLILSLTLGEFKWNIAVAYEEGNQEKVAELFNQFKFYDFHPLFEGSRLISENKEKNERFYEIKERLLDLGFYKHVAANQGKFIKVSQNDYILEVTLGVLGYPLSLFKMEFHISDNEIVEKATISGSYILSKIVHLTGQGIHQKMLVNLRNSLPKQN